MRCGCVVKQNIYIICSILVSTCSVHSILENEYHHFIFLTRNTEVIGSLKWPNHTSYPSLLILKVFKRKRNIYVSASCSFMSRVIQSYELIHFTRCITSNQVTTIIKYIYDP